MRKPAFCICQNKGADQRLCFRYIGSSIPLLPKFGIPSLSPASEAVQPCLCQIFSSPEPKAHWRAYRIPTVQRPSVVRPSTISKVFSSETAWPIKAKFYVEPPWLGGTKVCSLHLGHMTKMAAMPIYGKNPSKIFFSRTGGPISTKLVM